MLDMGRHLITSSDERTWKFDRPVIFLGEWCRLYSRREIWLGMDAIVAAPYGLGPGKRKRDIEYVQSLSNKLLIELTEKLNANHNTNYSSRYWNILIGYWLQRYVSTLFNRYSTLEQVFENYEISGTTLFDSTQFSLSTQDSNNFVWATNDERWNHVLYGRILAFLNREAVIKGTITLGKIEQCSAKVKLIAKPRWWWLKKLLRKIASHVFPLFSAKDDAFIINTYLPKWQEIKLQLQLGQFPQLWKSPVLDSVLPDLELRATLQLNLEHQIGFERFVRSVIWEVIPTCYLEGYHLVVKRLASLAWPQSPKFIFTSNNFSCDEVFKAWAAEKTEHGVPYYIGQHGNLYGTHLGNQNWPERTTPDKFLTWGWSDLNTNTVPVFALKLLGRKVARNPQGGLLLIELPVRHRITVEDSYFEFGKYFEEQFCFVRSLPADIYRHVTVRLHSEYSRHNFEEVQQWREFDSDINVENGEAPINSLIRKNRLVVHSYDSTGLLETLALDIPTICFWRGGLDHLEASAKPYYTMLEKAGILMFTPEKAAEAVSMNWDNIESWWTSEKVQLARKEFCAQYASIKQGKVSYLKDVLKN